MFKRMVMALAAENNKVYSRVLMILGAYDDRTFRVIKVQTINLFDYARNLCWAIYFPTGQERTVGQVTYFITAPCSQPYSSVRLLESGFL